jgi:hypothetical protein
MGEESLLGDEKSLLGDEESLLGDEKSLLGAEESLLGDEKSLLGDDSIDDVDGDKFDANVSSPSISIKGDFMRLGNPRNIDL